MRIEILRPTTCGKRSVVVGEIVEASETDARFLIGIGKARVVVEPPPEAEEPRRRRGLTTRTSGALIERGLPSPERSPGFAQAGGGVPGGS